MKKTLIKTLDFIEIIMDAIMSIDPSQQPLISRDLKELKEIRETLINSVELNKDNSVCPDCGSSKTYASIIKGNYTCLSCNFRW